MEKKIHIFWDTIKTLDENGILPYLVLVGSWAEYLYEAVYYKGYNSYLKTKDMDFLIPNINKPKSKFNLAEVLVESGYIQDIDYLTGVTKFYKDGVIELEFLATVKGSGEKTIYEVQTLGIKVEGLRHIDFLSDNSFVLLANDLYIRVPYPQAYLLHKLMINEQRQGYKKEKDINAVKNLLFYLKENPQEHNFLKMLYENRLTQNQRKKISKICEEAKIVLF
ncbi:MAG: GSU2403 family nucleotidyltransferase fold protein [Clostridia bacterium]|nr:GSU2403 family nucleotidyltransferase fold protein [Clostridia bacterium]